MSATTLILTYAISHGLGVERLGVFSLTFFYYYLFAFLTSFELTLYLGRESAHNRDKGFEIKKLVEETAASFFLGLGISLIILIYLIFFHKPFDTSLIIVTGISGIILGIEKNQGGFLLGREEMHVEFIVQLISFVIVNIPVLLIIKSLDIVGIYLLRIAASLLSIIIRWLFSGMRGQVDFRSLHIRFHNAKEILYFSVSGLCYFIQYHIDIFILSFFVTVDREGAYFTALRVFSALCMLPEVTSFALTPYISRVYREKETGIYSNFKKFYRKLMLWGVILGFLFSGSLFLLRHRAAYFFTQEATFEVARFIGYFSILLFFRFVSYYTGTLLSATRFQNIRFYIMIVSSVLMVGVGFLMAGKFNEMGILYTRAVMEVGIFIAYFIAMRKL